MKAPSCRVIGIDPGYDRMGIAIVERDKNNKDVLIFSTCIHPGKNDSLDDRLMHCAQEFERVVNEYRPSLLSLEKIFFTKNQRTGIAVAEVRGIIRYLAHTRNLLLHEFTPQQIKQSVTGYGNAPKEQVARMVDMLLRLPKQHRDDDEYDAIAAGLTALQAMR